VLLPVAESFFICLSVVGCLLDVTLSLLCYVGGCRYFYSLD